MSYPLAILKYAAIAVAVALPITIPTLVDRCVSCVRAQSKVTKELGLGVLNCLSCGVVQMVRTIKSPLVREDTLEALIKKALAEINMKGGGPEGADSAAH